tara:strand:- start:26256 stop:26699 length:444 start_codon:yes stop_codon:yes gene_type:complete
MNENLNDQLAKLLEKSISIAEKTGEFVIDQAPELLQEFYTWHITKSCLGIFIAVVAWAILWRISYFFGDKKPFTYVKYKGYSYKKPDQQSVKRFGRYFKEDSDNIIGIPVFRVCAFFILVAIAAPNVYRLVKILVSPKLYLIEYFLR